LRSTILANILASRGAVAAAAAARRTRAAPAFCIRLAWCIACRPPGIVNCRRANAAHALSIDDGFRSMVTNLPISALLRNMKTMSKNQLKKGKL
jgi:hypothetical protein